MDQECSQGSCPISGRNQCPWGNVHTLRATFHDQSTNPELYDEDHQWAQIMTRLTTIATEYDDTFKKVKKTQRTVNNASRGGGGRSGRGETRGGHSTGWGSGTGNVAANTGWIDQEKWKAMSPAEQQQAKDANAAARLQAARDRKQQSERTIANLLQKAGQYGSVPTAVTVPTSTPVTFDLQSLAGLLLSIRL